MSEENTEAVEVTITARDSKNQQSSYSFEYTGPIAGVDEAVDDLKHGFIGTIDRRIKQVNQGE